METHNELNCTRNAVNRYERYELSGCTIYQAGGVIACFAKQLPNNVIIHIIKQQPHTLVLCKAAFANPKLKAAIEHLFSVLSPQTVIELLD